MPRPNSKWIRMVLLDIERHCHENDLSVVASHLESARRELRRLRDAEKKASKSTDIENFEGLRLVRSQPAFEEEVEMLDKLSDSQ